VDEIYVFDIFMVRGANNEMRRVIFEIFRNFLSSSDFFY
jgi:hypothetical protein